MGVKSSWKRFSWFCSSFQLKDHLEMIIAFCEKEFSKFISSSRLSGRSCGIIIWYGTTTCENVSWNIEIKSLRSHCLWNFLVLNHWIFWKGFVERTLWEAREMIDKDHEQQTNTLSDGEPHSAFKVKVAALNWDSWHENSITSHL